MANDCCGVLKVVSKNKDVIERLKKIFNYEDDEYCLYRVRNFEEEGGMYEDGEWFVQDFFIDGAWSCEPFLNYGNNPEDKLVIDFEKDDNGQKDYTKKIYGRAHFTDLSHLAKVLGFGCEFWTEEPGMMFAEHGLVNCDGHYEYDTADYEISYPEKEDGDYDYDHPIEKCGFGKDWKEWMYADEIYGDNR